MVEENKRYEYDLIWFSPLLPLYTYRSRALFFLLTIVYHAFKYMHGIQFK